MSRNSASIAKTMNVRSFLWHVLTKIIPGISQIAMGKTRDLFYNKSLDGSAQRYLAPSQRHFKNLLTSVFVSTHYLPLGGIFQILTIFEEYDMRRQCVSMTLDGETSFFLRQQREMHVNISITVKSVGRIYLMAERF